VYTPEGEPEELAKDTTAIQGKFFGDHRLNVVFNWKYKQDTAISSMFRMQMAEELEDLRDSIKDLELDGFDLKEAKLSERFLVDLIDLIDQRQRKETKSA
jgi:hypothetical protein